MRWIPISDFPWYEVSETGLVRRCADGTILAQRPTEKGYLRVELRRDGRIFKRRVHLLVLEAFVGRTTNPLLVGAHYPDRDPANNAVTNLRWAFPEENEADKKAHGTHRNGRGRKLTEDEIVAIRESRFSHAAEARARGVHPHTISRIRRRLRHPEAVA
jgi:hypothetical protein